MSDVVGPLILHTHTLHTHYTHTTHNTEETRCSLFSLLSSQPSYLRASLKIGRVVDELRVDSE